MSKIIKSVRAVVASARRPAEPVSDKSLKDAITKVKF